ncbi:MAG: hypothetical protein AB2814_00955 [Candidatus Sedimenticola endophacoides]
MAVSDSKTASGGWTRLDADNHAVIGAVAAGAQIDVEQSRISAGGSVAVNTLVKTTESYVTGEAADKSRVEAWDGIGMSADDGSHNIAGAGSLAGAGGGAVGAAIAVNTVIDTTKSHTENAELSAGSMTFDVHDDVAGDSDRITFDLPHHLGNGDRLIYRQGAAGDIGLVDGGSYYVTVFDDNTVTLSESVGGPTVDLTQSLDASVHSFTKGGKQLDFDLTSVTIGDGDNSLTFAATHGLVQGEAVMFSNADGSIDGLRHERSYYVIRIDDHTIRLAESVEQAAAGEALDIALLDDGEPRWNGLKITSSTPPVASIRPRTRSLSQENTSYRRVTW